MNSFTVGPVGGRKQHHGCESSQDAVLWWLRAWGVGTATACEMVLEVEHESAETLDETMSYWLVEAEKPEQKVEGHRIGMSVMVEREFTITELRLVED